MRTKAKKRLVPAAMSVAVTLGTMALMPAPAEAASGGGCGQWDPIDACISFTGTSVAADFYLNVPRDYSRCIAVLGIFKNGSLVTQRTYSLGGQGRYGPISSGTVTMPPSSGRAFARVGVYNCDWGWHYQVDSPTVYYP